MPNCTNPEYEGSVCPSPEICGRDGCQYATNQSRLREQHAAYTRAPGHIQWNPEGTTPPPDPVTESIRQELLLRQRVGWTKYGIGLGRGDFSMRDWLHHLYEEQLDSIQYTKRLLMTLDGSLPVAGSREDLKLTTELPAQEIGRLTKEIGERQSRILQLVGVDPAKRYTLTEEPGVVTHPESCQCSGCRGSRGEG